MHTFVSCIIESKMPAEEFFSEFKLNGLLLVISAHRNNLYLYFGAKAQIRIFVLICMQSEIVVFFVFKLYFYH